MHTLSLSLSLALSLSLTYTSLCLSVSLFFSLSAGNVGDNHYKTVYPPNGKLVPISVY